jgi:hypothetical protein
VGAGCFFDLGSEPETLRTELRADLSFAIGREVYPNARSRSNARSQVSP